MLLALWASSLALDNVPVSRQDPEWCQSQVAHAAASSAEGGRRGDSEAMPAPLTPVDISVLQAALEGFQRHVGSGRSSDSLLGRQALREDQLEPRTG